jgi:acetyltransferase-like isoleucine patch superfamily enzyme
MTLPEGSYTFTDFNDSEVEIGKYTSIAANCRFHGADNHITVIDRKRVSNNLDSSGYSKGKIIIGNDVWIGEGVRILSGAYVGDGAIVGAGAIVAYSVAPYSIVVGSPAGPVRDRFPLEQIEKLLKIAWWNWDREKIMQAQRDGDFNDIAVFLSKHA